MLKLPGKPQKVQMTFRLPAATVEGLIEMANLNNRSLNWAANELIRSGLDEAAAVVNHALRQHEGEADDDRT